MYPRTPTALSCVRFFLWGTLILPTLGIPPPPRTPIFLSYTKHFVRIDYYSDRRLIIITIPGLPHGLLATFDNDMRESLVSQGFLWPSWDTQRLKSCGAARITLVHGRTRRETQPDGGLKILNQKLPFLLVEVADSQEYDNVLEKASWMLKHSKEKIRFAILIKLVRATAKEKRNNKRAPRDAEFSPRPITKKVRMDDDDFLLSESDDIDFAAFKLTHDSVVRSLDYGLDSDISELSNVASRDLFDFSILTTPEIPHPTVELEPKTIEFFPAGDVSFQARDPTSNISNDPANPPPRRNFFPVDETSYHSSSPLPRIETLSTTVATGPPSVSASRRPDSASGAPPTPDNPRAAYSSAFATVLTSYPVTGTHHEVNTPLDCVEFWPRRPGPTDNFTFGWEDMPGVRYPKVMRGKRFTIAFDGLHDTLEAFMRTTDSSRVRENVEHLMGEWIDEWDSVESEVSEEGD